MLATERASVAGEKVGRCSHRKGIFCVSGPGSVPLKERPNRWVISPEKIVSAMPAVKPMVTG